MARIALAALAVLACAGLVGCGSKEPEAKAPSATAATPAETK